MKKRPQPVKIDDEGEMRSEMQAEIGDNDAAAGVVQAEFRAAARQADATPPVKRPHRESAGPHRDSARVYRVSNNRVNLGPGTFSDVAYKNRTVTKLSSLFFKAKPYQVISERICASAGCSRAEVDVLVGGPRYWVRAMELIEARGGLGKDEFESMFRSVLRGALMKGPCALRRQIWDDLEAAILTSSPQPSQPQPLVEFYYMSDVFSRDRYLCERSIAVQRTYARYKKLRASISEKMAVDVERLDFIVNFHFDAVWLAMACITKLNDDRIRDIISSAIIKTWKSWLVRHDAEEKGHILGNFKDAVHMTIWRVCEDAGDSGAMRLLHKAGFMPGGMHDGHVWAEEV